MSYYEMFASMALPLCWFILAMAEDVAKAAGSSSGGGGGGEPGPAPAPAATNSSHANTTSTRRYADLFSVDSSMIQRALYVLIGITMIGVLYFLIRAVRLKKPAHKKKYGLLSNYDESMELDAVESDDDNTLYEAQSLRR